MASKQQAVGTKGNRKKAYGPPKLRRLAFPNREPLADTTDLTAFPTLPVYGHISFDNPAHTEGQPWSKYLLVRFRQPYGSSESNVLHQAAVTALCNGPERTLEAAQALVGEFDKLMRDRPMHWLQHWDKPCAVAQKYARRDWIVAMKKKEEQFADEWVVVDGVRRKEGALNVLTMSGGESEWRLDVSPLPGRYTFIATTGGKAVLYVQVGINQSVKIWPGVVVALQAGDMEYKLVWEGEADGPRFVYIL